MTQIIITSEDPQFAAVVALLAGPQAGAAPKSEPETAPKPAPKKTPKYKADPDPEPEAVTTVDPAVNAALYDEVKKAILALSAQDRDAAVSVLRTYGVARGSELTPDQYAAVLADLQAALEPEDDLS